MNQYLDQKDIIEYLLATDVYVTPYLDPNQITSGTLSYALGAGKAVVSTPYLHAQEALAKDRGILVEFRSAEAIAEAVNTILDDPKRKARLEKNAYTYANQATWPKTGARFLSAMQELVDEHVAEDQEAQGRQGAAAGGASSEGQPADQPGGLHAVPTGVRGDLHDQPGRGAGGRRDGVARARRRATRAPTRSSPPTRR